MIGKAALLRIHKYCGLAAALVLLVQALTGMTLVYRADIAQWLDPAGMVRRSAGSDLAPDRILAAAEAAYPEFRVQRLVYPVQLDATYVVHMIDAGGVVRYVSIDPASAEVLRTGNVWRFPAEAALHLHYQLMAGVAGMALVALAGAALLCLGVTGLIFWWPKRGKIRKSLGIQWRMNFRLVLRQLHRSTGVVIAIVLGFSATTGLLLSIPMLFEAEPVPSFDPSRAGPVAPAIDDALTQARREFPGHTVRDLRLPEPGQLNIFFNAPERNSRAVHLVSIDLSAPRIVTVRPTRSHRALWVVALPLHTGETFGAAGRALILLGGFMLMLLAASGPVMWFQASRTKRRASRRSTSMQRRQA